MNLIEALENMQQHERISIIDLKLKDLKHLTELGSVASYCDKQKNIYRIFDGRFIYGTTNVKKVIQRLLNPLIDEESYIAILIDLRNDTYVHLMK